jgi:hypothetical protein
VVYSRDFTGLTENKNAMNANNNEKLQKFQEFTGLTRSLNAFWSAFLGDYGSLPEKDSYVDFCKVVYALFITVVALNIMSMYFLFFALPVLGISFLKFIFLCQLHL